MGMIWKVDALNEYEDGGGGGGCLEWIGSRASAVKLYTVTIKTCVGILQNGTGIILV